MGTPEFAEYSLRRLVEEGFNVVGVVTVADKPIGRHGSILQPSPVKQLAQSCGIPVLQPERLKDESFLAQLRDLRADLQIVVAFRMLPEVVWSMPPMGTFNLHASLLPKYRGAAPINWAVINGDRVTGATTFLLQHEIDTGDIIDQITIPILEDDDAGSIHDKLMVSGADLLITTADAIISGTVSSRPQPELATEEMLPAPKIFKETCRIDWHRDSVAIWNFIRGLSPYPGAWSRLRLDDDRVVDFKIFKAETRKSHESAPCGTVLTDGRSYMDVVAGDGCVVRLLDVQMAGKKRMPVAALLCGLNVSSDIVFE